MKQKYFALAAALLISTGAQAQFVIEKSNGDTLRVYDSQKHIIQGSDEEGWTVGGVPVGEVKSISAMTLSERMASFAPPTNADYYRPISGWNQRAEWNLANVHDPSVMLAEDGYYYMYTTDASFGNSHVGHGHFMCRRSRNLVDWEFLGGTMNSVPSWVKEKLNEIRSEMGLAASETDFSDDTQFGYWAPCARKVRNGLYRMYYAITCPGTINGDGTWGERAFIGLMETATPWDITSWEDKGYVLTNASDKQLNFNVASNDWANCYFKWNAIDPSYIITPEGEHWLVYGSWHSGFAAMQLDAATGKPQNELGLPWGNDISAYGKLIYTRQKGNRWQGSEAPEVVYRNGYYYLFIAYDELAVAYNTRVVRSKHIDGPYYTIDGVNVTANGGDAYPLLTHPYKYSEDHGWVGISHCAVFDDGQDNWYYASQGRLPANVNNDAYSNAIMLGHVRRIVWTEDGWPLVMPERYSGVPQTPITHEEIVGQWENIALIYSYQKQNVPQTITLTADGKAYGAPIGSAEWTYDEAKGILTVGSKKLYLSRETDWEASPRTPTLVYAALDGKQTHWGKKLTQPTQTFGATDNSAAFWTAFTPYLASTTNDCTFEWTFKNFNGGTNNWDNWLLVITNGKQREESGYTEYAVLRADAYGWGTFATDEQRAAGMTNDYNWDSFVSDMNGATVALKATISGSTLTMTAVTTTEAGAEYNYKYTVSGLPAGSKGAFLTMEKSHLVLDVPNCGVR